MCLVICTFQMFTMINELIHFHMLVFHMITYHSRDDMSAVYGVFVHVLCATVMNVKQQRDEEKGQEQKVHISTVYSGFLSEYVGHETRFGLIWISIF